jgi:hypothetical protein
MKIRASNYERIFNKNRWYKYSLLKTLIIAYVSMNNIYISLSLFVKNKISYMCVCIYSLQDWLDN